VCAIESAALNNPKALIQIYTLNAKLKADDELLLLEHFDNIQVTRINLDDEFNSVEFMADWWLKKGKQLIASSEFHVSHTSDLLRFYFLWKHGDFYFDLDTIIVRNLRQLLQFPGVCNEKQPTRPGIGSATLVFPKESPIMRKALDEYIRNYEPKKWGYNGPELLERVLSSHCNVAFANMHAELAFDPKRLLINDNQTQSQASSSCNVSIFPSSYFNPYTWFESGKLFMKKQNLSIERFIDAYSIHFFGKMSQKKCVQPRDFSVYDYFAKRNCPLVYQRIESELLANKSTAAQFYS
jgi:hypothetical protein